MAKTKEKAAAIMDYCIKDMHPPVEDCSFTLTAKEIHKKCLKPHKKSSKNG